MINTFEIRVALQGRGKREKRKAIAKLSLVLGKTCQESRSSPQSLSSLRTHTANLLTSYVLPNYSGQYGPVPVNELGGSSSTVVESKNGLLRVTGCGQDRNR